MVQNIFRRLINEIYIEYFKPNGWKNKVQIIDTLMIVDLENNKFSKI